MECSPEVPLLLTELKNGDRSVVAKLTSLVYHELHRLAKYHMRHERLGLSLQPTALVNEAYLRMAGLNRMDWQSRAHFIAVASTVMRQILIDHARRRQTAKCGGEQQTVPLEADAGWLSPEQSRELLALDDALIRLDALDERQSRIVELRFFGGLTVEETAEALHISPKTVKREWAMARAWLHSQLRT